MGEGPGMEEIHFRDCPYFQVLECASLAPAQSQPHPRARPAILEIKLSPKLAPPLPPLSAHSQLVGQFEGDWMRSPRSSFSCAP